MVLQCLYWILVYCSEYSSTAGSIPWEFLSGEGSIIKWLLDAAAFAALSASSFPSKPTRPGIQQVFIITFLRESVWIHPCISTIKGWLDLKPSIARKALWESVQIVYSLSGQVVAFKLQLALLNILIHKMAISYELFYLLKLLHIQHQCWT